MLLVLESKYLGSRRIFKDIFEKFYLFIKKNSKPFPSKLIIVSRKNGNVLHNYVKSFISPEDFTKIGLPISSSEKNFVESFLVCLKSNSIIINPAETPIKLKAKSIHEIHQSINIILPFHIKPVEEVFPEILINENDYNFWYYFRGPLKETKYGGRLVQHNFIKTNFSIDAIITHPEIAFFFNKKDHDHYNRLKEKIKDLTKDKYKIDVIESFKILDNNEELNRSITYFIYYRYHFLYFLLKSYSEDIRNRIIAEIISPTITFDYQLYNPKENIESSRKLFNLSSYLLTHKKQHKTKKNLFLQAQVDLFDDIKTKDLKINVRKLIENKAPDIFDVTGNLIFYLLLGKDKIATESDGYLFTVVDIFLNDEPEANHFFYVEVRDNFIEYSKRFFNTFYPTLGKAFMPHFNFLFSNYDSLIFILALFFEKFMEVKRINNPADAYKYFLIILFDQYYLHIGENNSESYSIISKIFKLSPAGVKAVINRKLGMELKISDNLFEIMLPLKSK